MKRYLVMLLLALPWGAIAAGDCARLSETCTDGPATKVINGVAVTRACWRYQDVYDCRSAAPTNDCQALRDRGCAQVDVQCVSRLDDGRCTMSQQVYQCQDRAASTTDRTVCDQGTFCSNDAAGCFPTGSPPDQDFARAAAMMEGAREAGVYGVPGGQVELFKGYGEECSTKVLGGAAIKSCCAASGGGAAMTNHALLTTGLSAGGAVASEALKSGSNYVYDALYQNIDNTVLKEGLIAMGSSLGDLSAGSGFGAYGFQFSFSMSDGFTLTGFDPGTFALSIGVMLIQQWLACSPAEQSMSLKRGQHLCDYVGTYCARRVLGVCLERKERHCCFNSVLARLINRQGRAQLGLPADQCGGFSETQLQALDFGAMDLSEFIATIAPVLPDAAQMGGKAGQTVQQRITHYYDQ